MKIVFLKNCFPYIFNEGISYVGFSINHSLGLHPQAFDAVGVGTGKRVFVEFLVVDYKMIEPIVL